MKMVPSSMQWISLVLLTLVKDCLSTECSYLTRVSNEGTCLTRIKADMKDINKFWFGTSYSTQCNNPSIQTASIDCYNPLGSVSGARSLASLVFWSGTFDESKIDRFLNVTYTSNAGWYHGCSTRHTQTGTRTFTLDPLSADTYPPWESRATPAVTWRADPGKEYTLFVKDVGLGSMHAMYVNIEGNRLQNSKTTIKAYTGPLNSRSLPNPYVFLLYEQLTIDMTVSTSWRDSVNSNINNFNISDYVSANQLQGPVAANWLLASYDAFSVQSMKNKGILDNCAGLVAQKLAGIPRPFIPTHMKLPSFVNVTIRQEERLKFGFCCKSYNYGPQTMVADPVGSPVLPSAVPRSTQRHTITYSLNKRRMFPNNTVDYQNQWFTVLSVDPDATSTVASNSRPLVHGLSTNMQFINGQLQNGNEVLKYMGPKPPRSGDYTKPHVYYFLVYRQLAGRVNVTSDHQLSRWTGSNCPSGRVMYRCLFDVTLFVYNNSLQLEGISWFKARNDDYVNYQNKVSQTVACQGRAGYGAPCPVVGGATPTTHPPTGLTRATVLLLPTALVLVALHIDIYQFVRFSNS